MRYDKLLAALDRARDRFETEIRSIVATVARDDADMSTKMLKTLKKHHNGKYWTQRPENRKKLIEMTKRAAASRKAAKS